VISKDETQSNRKPEDREMKISSKKGSFIAAMALGAAILVGSSLPSQAQTTAQPQAQAQSALPSGTAPVGWNGPGYGPPMGYGCGCGWGW